MSKNYCLRNLHSRHKVPPPIIGTIVVNKETTARRQFINSETLKLNNNFPQRYITLTNTFIYNSEEIRKLERQHGEPEMKHGEPYSQVPTREPEMMPLPDTSPEDTERSETLLRSTYGGGITGLFRTILRGGQPEDILPEDILPEDIPFGAPPGESPPGPSEYKDPYQKPSGGDFMIEFLFYGSIMLHTVTSATDRRMIVDIELCSIRVSLGGTLMNDYVMKKEILEIITYINNGIKNPLNDVDVINEDIFDSYKLPIDMHILHLFNVALGSGTDRQDRVPDKINCTKYRIPAMETILTIK